MAQKPVSARELADLHARIGRDVAELRTRASRATTTRRASPEDIVHVALRTFRAVRMLQEAVGGPRASAGVLALLLGAPRSTRPAD